jgi:hypothetical protein
MLMGYLFVVHYSDISSLLATLISTKLGLYLSQVELTTNNLLF